jgi:hypothetical protein
MAKLLNNHTVVQIGMLTDNIEKATAAWADFLGVDMPGISITDEYPVTKTNYRGNPSPARCKQSFFDLGKQVRLELIEPDHEPSYWRECLDKNGPGFHHIAFFVEGMAQTSLMFEAEGMPLTMKGEWKGGRYAYHDASDKLNMVLELLEDDPTAGLVMDE